MGFDREDELDMDKKTDEIIDEYLKNMDVDTEGIWMKVEAGLDKIETADVMQETDTHIDIIQPDLKGKKSRKRKIAGYIWGTAGAAAVIIATMIVLPFVTGVKNKDSDTYVFDNLSTDKSADVESIYEETANEESAFVNKEGIQGNDMEERNGDTRTHVTDTTAAGEGVNAIDDVPAADVKIRIVALQDDRALCEVTYAAENEFGISAGQEIYVKFVDDGDDEPFSAYELDVTLVGLLAQSDEAEVYLFYPYVD